MATSNSPDDTLPCHVLEWLPKKDELVEEGAVWREGGGREGGSGKKSNMIYVQYVHIYNYEGIEIHVQCM